MQPMTFVVLFICFAAFGNAQKLTRENFNVQADPRDPAYVNTDAVRVGNTMYVSGLHAADPANMKFADEMREVLDNMRRLVQAGRLTMQHVAKTTVYLTDWNNYDEMNQIYRTYFPDKFPARSALQVVALPKGAHVKIEAVAVHSDL